MKKGTIITNAFISGEGQTNQVARLKEEFSRRGVAVDVRRNCDTAYISNNDIVVNLNYTDFVIYLDKDYHIAALLQKAGVRLFNSADCLRLCDDKMATYIAMCGEGITMPTTLSSPLNYALEYDENAFIDSIESKIPYPLIVKQCHGSMGKQVFLAQDRQQLQTLYTKLRNLPHIYQQYISSSKGKDVRIVLVGGKIVAFMQRENKNDFRSNIETGGTGSVCTISPIFTQFAQKVAKIVGADYCGIDVLSLSDGTPVLCEVNCNAFYKGIESVTKINIASHYVDYILKNI